VRAATLALTLAMLTAGLAGCIGTDEPLDEASTPDADDAGDDLDTTGGWSTPSQPQQYEVQPSVHTHVESVDGVEISIAYWLPDIDGCDWNETQLPAKCQLPTVLEGGPYFLDNVDEEGFRPPKVQWFATRGYAVVDMSLRGTGESGGCYEFKNPKDVDDVDQVVDWIADQAWSDGDVGMIGRSYDGTAAWAGAASGNEHLETIVPISGAVDGPHLYYKNGTSETRGFMQPTFYYLYAFGLVADDPTYRVPDYVNTLCPEAAEDWVRGPKAGATGDASSDYWRSRDLTDDILEGYDGSAWVIHGMQDYNVNPSQVVPFTHEMRHEGIETLVWLGQWDHAYPDRVDEHRNIRWDWADRLLEWFDHYLKQEGEQPYLGVEVEDSLYVWRQEEAYPPHDVDWRGLELGADGELAEPGQASSGEFVLAGPPAGAAGHWNAETTGSQMTFTSPALEDDLRIAGLPRLHVQAEPTTPQGGWLFAELYDVYPDGQSLYLGWAAMDLRYHEGGNTDPATLTPGEPVTAKMQFEPMDAHVAEGHQLRLVVHKAGVADIGPSPDPEPNVLHFGDGASVLELPTVERDLVLDGEGEPRQQDPAPNAPPATLG
jgi:predicted acyl esterase